MCRDNCAGYRELSDTALDTFQGRTYDVAAQLFPNSAYNQKGVMDKLDLIFGLKGLSRGAKEGAVEMLLGSARMGAEQFEAVLKELADYVSHPDSSKLPCHCADPKFHNLRRHTNALNGVH